MSSKRSFCCSYFIHILLVVSVIVEGSPVETTPKTADSAVLKAKDSPMFKGTEALHQNEGTSTPKGATHKAFPTTFKIEASTTLKPGTPATTTDRKGHKELNDITTTANPTRIERIPFKPSPQIFGDLNSSVKQTTQTPTTIHNTTSTKDKHVKPPQSPTTHKNPPPVRITRIYRVKSQKGCSCSEKKEHDVKVHIGEGRYLNIKITED